MANRFDEKYDIRLAEYAEIPDVMSFIDTHWKKGHILASNREFFEYEMVVDGQVNFLIAKRHEDGSIDGVLGFLPCSRSTDKLDIWGVIWMTVPGSLPMLGMELKKRLMQTIGARCDLGTGANPETSVPLLARIYHYYTAKMKHYYRLADLDGYKIAVVNKKIIPPHSNEEAKIEKIENIGRLREFFDFSVMEDCVPYKDSWYYERRFFNHPLYEYDVWSIAFNDSRAFMVTRRQECNGSSIIRIVDYAGVQSLFGKTGAFLDKLLNENEYVDFYFDGFDEKYAREAGMIETDDADNIIPNYFSPYSQENVDIYVDSSDNVSKCLFFKADGDQDRPS
ncbi:MAG: hypothetical protein K6F73_05555 [Lachnospiraceae bacterium]|nr:hypothetical protein [Lachnospiraceae bacterium]